MKPEYIIIHHSHTADTQTASWPAIRQFHLSNGWQDIGYQFGLEDLRGSVEILMGRFMDEPGAHCVGYNSKSIGICLVGNFDAAEPSKEIWDKAINLVRNLQRLFSIQRKNVLGHRETGAPKTCPGSKFDMDKFRRDCNA